jgi:hypothetical protein
MHNNDTLHGLADLLVSRFHRFDQFIDVIGQACKDRKIALLCTENHRGFLCKSGLLKKPKPNKPWTGEKLGYA